MELVDDDHVEMPRIEGRQPRGIEALDRGEDLLEPLRALPRDPELPEGGIAQRLPEGRPALGQDLLPMGDEQQAGARKPSPQSCVVERCHHGFPGSGRRNEEVPVVPRFPGQLDLLEEPLLERVGAHLHGADEDLGAGRSIDRTRPELLAVVRLEFAAVPIALEDRGHLLDDVRVARPGDPDVPFEPRHLRLVRQVRRADVGGRETRVAVKDPGLRVQPRRTGVVGNPHLGAGFLQRVERPRLSRTGVGRRQKEERPPLPAVGRNGLHQRRNAAPADEGHHHVDPVGRRDLLEDLPPDPRLPRRVGQQRRIEQRNQRLGDRLRRAVRTESPDRPENLRRRRRDLAGHLGFRPDSVQRLQEPPRHLETERQPLLLAPRLDGPANQAGEVNRDPVGRLGLPEPLPQSLQLVAQLFESALEERRQQRLVQAAGRGGHWADSTGGESDQLSRLEPDFRRRLSFWVRRKPEMSRSISSSETPRASSRAPISADDSR